MLPVLITHEDIILFSGRADLILGRERDSICRYGEESSHQGNGPDDSRSAGSK